MERSQLRLSGKERVVILPICVLVPCTFGSFGCTARIWMDLVQWEIPVHHPYFSRFDVFIPDLSFGLVEHPLAERTLVVAEFDERHRRIHIAQDNIVIYGNICRRLRGQGY